MKLENSFKVNCPRRGLNSDLWDLKLVCYPLSHPCLFRFTLYLLSSWPLAFSRLPIFFAGLKLRIFPLLKYSLDLAIVKLVLNFTMPCLTLVIVTISINKILFWRQKCGFSYNFGDIGAYFNARNKIYFEKNPSSSF